jgi:pimeloyl-ACP methyl ester carboxylesterase
MKAALDPHIVANPRLHILPKCGHWAMWERADESNALVGLFLKNGG